jgi:hypothetical protein
VQAAAAAAVSSGVQRLEAAVVVTGAGVVADADRAVLAELGVSSAFVADHSGTIVDDGGAE